MSHFTLKSGIAEEVRTRCCPICLRRYAYQPSDGYATLGCENPAHLEQYAQMVLRLAPHATPYAHMILAFDAYNHVLDARIADYVAAHPDALPEDCHLPQESPHEPIA